MIENGISDDKTCVKRIAENLSIIIKLAEKHQINLSDGDHNDIDEIIFCLQDLEDQRIKAHHVWEIESIKYEALRHKVTLYPSQITDEIQRAIGAARGLNEKTISDLRDTLEAINVSIDTNSDLFDRLNIENEQLIPNLRDIKITHDEVVVLLNQHLSIKADRQINLNQIRDTIKKNNEKIVELEEDVFHLKETMIKERATGREEKKRLLKEINITQDKLDIQNSKNDDLNKIYQNLKHEVAETTMSVNEKTNIFEKYVKTIEELKKRQNELDSQIENTLWSNQKLKEEIKLIEEKSIQSKYDFKNANEEFNEEISMLNSSVNNHKTIQFELLSVKEEASEELSKSHKIEEEVSLSLRSFMEKLKNIETDSASKAADVGQLIFEMEEMERNIVEGKEVHEATVMAINSQIANLKKQLEKERKERIEVQKDNSEIQEQINLFRADHTKFLRNINAKVNDSKSEHSRMLSHCKQLQRKIQEELAESGSLKTFILENEETLRNEKSEMTDTVSKLTKENFEMEKEENEIKRRLEENEPSFQELQVYYDKHLKDYEKLKKDLVGLKNRKSALDEAMERIKRSMLKESVDLERLKEQKKLNESQLDSQIESESLRRSEIEREIYVLGCKTSTVKEEITRLQNSINEMDRLARILRDSWEKAIHISSKMKQDLALQKVILTDGWTDDSNLELDFKNKETEEVDKLKRLLKQTEERGFIVTAVSDKLYSEIKSFGTFLSNMASISVQKGKRKDHELNKGALEVLEKIENLANIVSSV